MGRPVITVTYRPHSSPHGSANVVLHGQLPSEAVAPFLDGILQARGNNREVEIIVNITDSALDRAVTTPTTEGRNSQ